MSCLFSSSEYYEAAWLEALSVNPMCELYALTPEQVTVKGAGLDAAAVKEGVAKSGKKTELWQ